jgi:hypothetical protein
MSVAAGVGSEMAGVETTIVVRDRLRQGWTNEWVDFAFQAGAKECAPDSIRVTGPRGPVAAQLSGIEYWPDANERYVKSARLNFVVDELKPLSSNVYAVAYGKKAAVPEKTDLQIRREKDKVEIATAGVGVRLPLGDIRFPAPVASREVPGPLLAMRLGTNAWAGGSSLTGDVGVVAWSAEMKETGPVFARVAITYTLADSNAVVATATVIAGDNAVRWSTAVPQDTPGVGIVWRLPPVPGVKQAVMGRAYGQWSKGDRTQAIAPAVTALGRLGPDTSIANAMGDLFCKLQLVGTEGTDLRIVSRDPGAWSEPVPLTYAGYKSWDLDMIPKMWETWQRQTLPVTYSAADGAVALVAPLTRGHREWSVCAGAPQMGTQLDRVKDLVLDWPSADTVHPRVFVGPAELKDCWARGAADPEFMKLLTSGEGAWAGAALRVLMKPADQRIPTHVEAAVRRLRDQLALLGNFDVMRHAIGTVALYDALIDSDLITPADRTLFRSQMAYLGYVMADPQCWSMERGYLSGNPNMSCSYTLSLGVLACALSDHPAARAWAGRATQWMDKWLADEVGTKGEWVSEGTGYGYVSLEPMLAYAVAAKRAGYRDFSNDPRLKKLMLYFAQFHTPRDPQKKNLRRVIDIGRGAHGGCSASFGVAAEFFKDTDPALSRTLQWLWNELGNPEFLGDSRMGSFDPYYLDRRLPTAAPAWGSELFPDLGALLRAGFNTSNESAVAVLTCVRSQHNLDIWTPEIGGIAQWFGRGQFLSTFTYAYGYNERHELLRNGVRLARNWGAEGDPKLPFGHYTETQFGAFAALPTMDYVRSAFVNTVTDDRDWFPANLPAYPKVTPATGTNLTWTRQVLFVKDPDPAGPAWLLLRDTTAGGQPTAWQFWTLSEKIGTPDQVRDPAAFLADKAGLTNLPSRELPMSDRYTALGQYGVDVDYFIVSPAATPRHTLRYSGMWGVYQDLLHLQLPADGAYYVALFPRPRGEATPTFTALAEGRLVKASGAMGTDYAFMATAACGVEAEGVSVKGTAASVQDRGDFVVLSLGAVGEVEYKGYGLSASQAAGLRAAPGGLTLTLSSAATADTRITLTAPDGFAPDSASASVKLDKPKTTEYVLTLPAGATKVTLALRGK